MPPAPIESRFFLEMISNTFDGIQLIRASDSRFVFVNRGTERMFGYGPGELLGQHVSILNAPGEVSPDARAEAIRSELENKGTWVGDIENRRKDGTTFWCHARVTPFDHHEFGKVWVSVHEDITVRKRAETNLHESQQHLRALLAQVHHTQNEERIRISRDIHDELGQLLTILKLEAHQLERKLSEPNIPPHLNPLLDQAVGISELADRTISVVQKIALGLRPVALEQLGFAAALRDKARRFEERTGIPCKIFIPDEVKSLPIETATELYHICKEALTNVARHARPTNVEIHLTAHGQLLELKVCDDGVGVSPEALQSSQSLGLLGMRERAHQLGAQFSIHRREPRGTIISVSVPLTSNNGLTYDNS